MGHKTIQHMGISTRLTRAPIAVFEQQNGAWFLLAMFKMSNIIDVR